MSDFSLPLLLQYSLRLARSEGSDARARAEKANTSCESVSQQLQDAKTAAAQAASTAAAPIDDLQVSPLHISTVAERGPTAGPCCTVLLNWLLMTAQLEFSP